MLRAAANTRLQPSRNSDNSPGNALASSCICSEFFMLRVNLKISLSQASRILDS